MKQELPSNQIPYSASLGVCQLLEDVMEEAEALADSCRGPKRRQLMAAPEEDNFFSASFRHCGSSDNLCSLQGNNQTAQNEEETLQMNTMHDEDIEKLLDWGTESGENSNGQSSVITTEDNLILDELTLLFPVDDDNNNNTNMTPTLYSCSWDNLSGIFSIILHAKRFTSVCTTLICGSKHHLLLMECTCNLPEIIVYIPLNQGSFLLCF